MKSFVRVLLFLMLVLPAAAFADTGARTVKYSDTEVIPIRAKVRFSTLIVLPADEEILDFTTGDKDFWIINGVHNLCYLHPAQTSIQSNLNLVTASGHVYSFLLTEISKDQDTEPDLKVFVMRDMNNASASLGQTTAPALVRATDLNAYKAEIAELRAELSEQTKASQDEVQKAIAQYREDYPAKLTFDYALPKKATHAPFLVSAVYHDERFTYIKSAAREKPALYEVKDGKPNLVNFDLENGVYIVPKIMDDGYLAVGKKRVSFHRHSSPVN